MSQTIVTPTARRGFLGRIAAAAAAIGVGGAVPSRLLAEQPVDRAADPKLEAWFGKLKGKHRQVFDVPEPNSGMGAIWPRVYLNTMEATYPGTGTTAMVILRHGGLGMAMQDSVWAKYKFGEIFGVKDGEVAATRNVYAKIDGLPIPGLGIAELLKGGVLVGACDVAMTVYSSGAAKKMGLDPAEVKKEWIAALFPGVQLVPSGVMAVARAQELGCAYCFAG